MLLHQAFGQVEQFTGRPAPREAMHEALAATTDVDPPAPAGVSARGCQPGGHAHVRRQEIPHLGGDARAARRYLTSSARDASETEAFAALRRPGASTAARCSVRRPHPPDASTGPETARDGGGRAAPGSTAWSSERSSQRSSQRSSSPGRRALSPGWACGPCSRGCGAGCSSRSCRPPGRWRCSGPHRRGSSPPVSCPRRGSRRGWSSACSSSPAAPPTSSPGASRTPSRCRARCSPSPPWSRSAPGTSSPASSAPSSSAGRSPRCTSPPRARWGRGTCKLAPALGAPLAAASWGGLVAAPVLAAVGVLVLVLAGGARRVPYGPPLLGATWLTLAATVIAR